MYYLLELDNFLHIFSKITHNFITISESIENVNCKFDFNNR